MLHLLGQIELFRRRRRPRSHHVREPITSLYTPFIALYTPLCVHPLYMYIHHIHITYTRPIHALYTPYIRPKSTLYLYPISLPSLHGVYTGTTSV